MSIGLWNPGACSRRSTGKPVDSRGIALDTGSWLLDWFSKARSVYWKVMDAIYKTYPHNPPHLFVPGATYMVTASTLHRDPILGSDLHRAIFCDTLFERAGDLKWSLEAWAVLRNHYHFIAQSPEDANTLVKLICQVHSITAVMFNRMDERPGRQVWHNYWDTCITYEASYLARLHYVHVNPVKHGLVERAEDDPYCSNNWFREGATPEMKEKVLGQPIDRIQIADDF